MPSIVAHTMNVPNIIFQPLSDHLSVLGVLYFLGNKKYINCAGRPRKRANPPIEDTVANK